MASTKRKNHKPGRSKHTKRMVNIGLQTNIRRALIPDLLIKTRIDVVSAEILLILKGSSAQPNIPVQSMPHVWPLYKPLLSESTTKQSSYKHRKLTAHQLKAGTIHAHDSNEEVDDSFCLQFKIQHVQTHHKKTHKSAILITNLADRLKQHENRSLYLRVRLDTCADLNVMPASVYKLVFRDPNLEKPAPNKMQMGTYTNDTVKIVGTCKLYLVHPDTKKLVETTFYVATNNGSMLLSCNSTLDLDLI